MSFKSIRYSIKRMATKQPEGKVEELMNPRYKLIARYPHYPFDGDTLFVNDAGELYHQTEGYCQGIYKIMESDAKESKCFKLLQWWEERKPEEMPEYVGYSAWIRLDGDMSEFNGEYEQVIKVKKHNLKAFDGKKFLAQWQGKHSHRAADEIIDYAVWWPATEDQYLEYQKLQNQIT